MGKRRYFDALDPRHSLDSPLERLVSQVEKARKLARALGELYSKADKVDTPLEYVEILHNNNNIHHHYCRLVHQAKEEILAFVRPPFACDGTEKVMEQQRAYAAFLDRGGAMRWAFETNDPDNAAVIQAHEFLIRKGLEVRTADKLPLKLMVFDRQEVLVTQEEVLSLSGELTMARMKHSAIAEAFRTLFMFFFDQSADYKTWKEKGEMEKEGEKKRVRLVQLRGNEDSHGENNMSHGETGS